MGEEVVFVFGIILAVGAIGYFALESGFMNRLSASQIGQYAANAGFSGQDLITAIAIALAESNGGNPNAHGDTTLGSGTGSFGLWQIYSDAHPEYGPDFTQLYDPQTNANAAFAIYRAAGNSFRPWSTFDPKDGGRTTPRYLAFMDQASAAVNV